MTRPLTQRLAQFAAAGAVVAFASSLAEHHPDAATAVESGFLALLAGLTLGALALGTRAAGATIGAGLLVALALCLPAADGTRGALVGLLLVAAVAWATWRTFATDDPPSWLDSLAPVLAWQALLRSERLLQFEWTPAAGAWLLALPLAAALGAWWLARQHQAPSALALLAALAVLGPGLGVVAVGTLVIAVLLARSVPPSRVGAGAAALTAAGAIWWLPAVAPALLLLVAALVWPRQGLARWLPALFALAWAASAMLENPSAGAFGWLTLSLPLAFMAPPANRPLLLTALALTLSIGPGADPALLAPALALAVLALPTDRIAQKLQAAWSLALLSAATVTSAYPWLREPPITQLSSIGPTLLALAVAGVAAAIAWTARRQRLRPPGWAWGLLFGGLLLASAMVPRPWSLTPEPVVLSSSQPTWQSAIPPSSPLRLTVDSFVAGGGGLATGEPVASIQLTGAEGLIRSLELRHGQHTADWAARRFGPEVATPPAWLTWLTGDGSLAQRYRARWRLEGDATPSRIEIVRRADLPPEVEIAILSVAAQ